MQDASGKMAIFVFLSLFCGSKVQDASGETSIFGPRFLKSGILPETSSNFGPPEGQKWRTLGAKWPIFENKVPKKAKSRILHEAPITFRLGGCGALATASPMCRLVQSEKWRTLGAKPPIFENAEKGPPKSSRCLGPLGGQKSRTLQAKWPLFDNQVQTKKAKSRIFPGDSAP